MTHEALTEPFSKRKAIMDVFDINNLYNGDRIYDKDEGKVYVLHFVSYSRSSFLIHTIWGCGIKLTRHLDVKEMLTDRYQPLSKMRKRVVYY